MMTFLHRRIERYWPCVLPLLICIAALCALLLPASAGQRAASDFASPPFPLVTPIGHPVPEVVVSRLPAGLPAGEGEAEATHCRVLEKKLQNRRVLLVLKEEQSGVLSLMSQSVGTEVSALDGEASGGANEVLPTRRIENVRVGMLVLARTSGGDKLRTRTLHQKATESVRVAFARSKAGSDTDILRGLPQHPLPTPDGSVALGKLKPGMKVRSRRGPPLVVKSVTREKHPRGIAVYTFEAVAPSEPVVDHIAESSASNDTNSSTRILLDSESPEEEAAVADALVHLKTGSRPAYGRKWGEHFSNREGRLPGIRGGGGYREYYVRPAPGERPPGARRLVVGSNGSIFYTRDHYQSFVKIK